VSTTASQCSLLTRTASENVLKIKSGLPDHKSTSKEEILGISTTGNCYEKPVLRMCLDSEHRRLGMMEQNFLAKQKYV